MAQRTHFKDCPQWTEFSLRVASMADENTLPDVGVIQDLPFSQELMDLYQQWQSQSKDERMSLSLEMASVFCAEHDPTDEQFSNEYHAIFDDFLAAQLKFETEAMRLSRLAIQIISDHLSAHGIDLDEVVTEKTPHSN
jgi:hypothetical protein